MIAIPLRHGDVVAVFVGRWAGGWVERADERASGALGFGKGVVDSKNRVLRRKRGQVRSWLLTTFRTSNGVGVSEFQGLP